MTHFCPSTSVHTPPSLGKEELFDLIGNVAGVTADSVEHLESNFDVLIHKKGALYYRMKKVEDMVGVKPIYNDREVFATREAMGVLVGVIYTHDDDGAVNEELETGDVMTFGRYLLEAGIAKQKKEWPSTFVIYMNEPANRYSSTVCDHRYGGKAVTWFDYEVLSLDDEKHKQDGMCHQVWNDGSITTTKGGVLFGMRRLKELPEWQPWASPDQCAHIKLPRVSEGVENHTFAFVSELGAYKIRNLIRLRLDEEARLRSVTQEPKKRKVDNLVRELDIMNGAGGAMVDAERRRAERKTKQIEITCPDGRHGCEVLHTKTVPIDDDNEA